MDYINKVSQLKVKYHADICIVGGSCTGVFAAVRAARLGARVIIVEKHNCFGGVATSGLVNVWHSLYDTDYAEQIIGGLTDEIIQKLDKNHSVEYVAQSASIGVRFDPNMLKYELDKMVQQQNIEILLNTFYTGIINSESEISAVTACNKEGNFAISAKFFIDASGDGDLCRDLSLTKYENKGIQPPSACYLTVGDKKCNLDELIKAHGKEYGLDNDWGWNGIVPNIDAIHFHADNHVMNVRCDISDDLTHAEIEGRRRAYALTQMINKYSNPDLRIVALCSEIGIRETVHYATNFKATERDLLTGKRYQSAVMNGTYRVDIHHSDSNGITFKYLDGRTETFYGKNGKGISSTWDDEFGFDVEHAKYYQMPFELLVQNQFRNFIPVGRMMNADAGAFGALRVMVNINQLGEAAGVAGYMCLDKNKAIRSIDGKVVRQQLICGGSIL